MFPDFEACEALTQLGNATFDYTVGLIDNLVPHMGDARTTCPYMANGTIHVDAIEYADGSLFYGVSNATDNYHTQFCINGEWVLQNIGGNQSVIHDNCLTVGR